MYSVHFAVFMCASVQFTHCCIQVYHILCRIAQGVTNKETETLSGNYHGSRRYKCGKVPSHPGVHKVSSVGSKVLDKLKYHGQIFMKIMYK